MAFKYQKGQKVYWNSSEYPSLSGPHTIDELGNTGEFYRIQDREGGFTDVPEEEIVAVVYHLFVTIPSGLPIIVPNYLPHYKEMHDKIHAFEHVLEGSAEQCLDAQINILTRMHIIPRQ